MKTHRLVVALVLVVAGAAALHAKKKHDNWLDEQFTQWSAQQVSTIFNKSPWAQTKSFRGQVTGMHGTTSDTGAGPASNGAVAGTGGGTLGVDVPDFSFTARFFSAQPIREAYVRMLQITNHYDSLPAEKQRAFDQQVADRILHFDVNKAVIVMLAYHTNDPIAQRDMNQWFATQTTDTLKQNAYLYVPKAGQIQLINYIPPQQGGDVLGAQFIFPRDFNGEPILEPGATGRVRFQFYQPQINQEMYIDFKPEEMMYQGQLSY